MASEVDLAAQVIAWLEEQHWDVYQEVQVHAYGGRADIVATSSFLVWVIEVKKTLNLGLMGQANHWHSHFRSIAVPAAKRHSQNRATAIHIAHKFYNLGVIEIQKGGYIRETHPAPLMREYHRFAKRISDSLVPEHKTAAKAGSRGGGFYTPYRATVNAVRHYLRDHPGATIKEIFDALGKMHYASMKSARSTMRKNIETIESDWCRVDKSEKPWRYYLKLKET